MIIKSQNINGKLTHVIKDIYVDLVLKGKGKQRAHLKNSFKPNGFWLSWNNGWENWCKAESFCDFTTHTILKAKLKPNLKVWLIDDYIDFIKMLDDFKKHNKLTYYGKDYSTKSELSWEILQLSCPDGFWDFVKSKVDAIALTDEGQWATRYNSFMHGWDCACILVFDQKNIIFTK